MVRVITIFVVNFLDGHISLLAVQKCADRQLCLASQLNGGRTKSTQPPLHGGNKIYSGFPLLRDTHTKKLKYRHQPDFPAPDKGILKPTNQKDTKNASIRFQFEHKSHPTIGVFSIRTWPFGHGGRFGLILCFR